MYLECLERDGYCIAKTAVPLFQAYEHAVDILEKIYSPLFHQSADFFLLKCGNRDIKRKRSVEDVNISKRKFMGFADLSKLTSRIKAKKMGSQRGGGERLSSMDELDYEEGCDEVFGSSCEDEDGRVSSEVAQRTYSR